MKFGAKQEGSDKLHYTFNKVDTSSTGQVNAIQTVRADGKLTTFTAARFGELMEAGKIEVQEWNTLKSGLELPMKFTLKKDADFNPQHRLKTIEELEA